MQSGFVNRSPRLHRARPAPDRKWDSVYPGGRAASTWREAKGSGLAAPDLKTMAEAGSLRVTRASVGGPAGGSAGQARPAVSPWTSRQPKAYLCTRTRTFLSKIECSKREPHTIPSASSSSSPFKAVAAETGVPKLCTLTEASPRKEGSAPTQPNTSGSCWSPDASHHSRREDTANCRACHPCPGAESRWPSPCLALQGGPCCPDLLPVGLR